MSEVVRKWVDKAVYDLDTAKAMYDTGRMPYVFFCCQQALEKLLKAIVCKELRQCPPRTHNLKRLADMLPLELSESQLILLQVLKTTYIKSRYPEDEEDSSIENPEYVLEILNQTKELFECLKSRM